MNKGKDLSFLRQELIAHRGVYDNKNFIPENSIKAFKIAVEKKLIIELDVHILRDNQIVVFHDDNLKRMTGVNKSLKELSYDQIKNLNLLDTNEKIPLLKDVLKLVKGKVPIIIELKYDVKCGLLENELIKLLKCYDGKFAVKSFNPKSVYYFRKNYPEAIRGQLASAFNTKKTTKVKKIFLKNILYTLVSKPDFISYDIRFLPNFFVKLFRKKKIVLGWTISNQSELEKAKKYCDNFICENIL